MDDSTPELLPQMSDEATYRLRSFLMSLSLTLILLLLGSLIPLLTLVAIATGLFTLFHLTGFVYAYVYRYNTNQAIKRRLVKLKGESIYG